jgi:hypothetical protein
MIVMVVVIDLSAEDEKERNDKEKVFRDIILSNPDFSVEESPDGTLAVNTKTGKSYLVSDCNLAVEFPKEYIMKDRTI